MKKALIVAHVASMIDLFNTENINLLCSLGYHVDVACNFDKGNVTSKQRVENFRKMLNANGVGTYHVPIPRSIFSLKDLFYSLKKIRDIVKENNYSIIHCQSPIGGVLARLACKDERKSETKIIYMVHGFHFYKGAPLKNWILYYPIEKVCSKFTDCLITINHEDYKLAKIKMNRIKQIEYVPGVGINISRINEVVIDKYEMRKQLNIPINSFVIVSVGELNKNKNHKVIIEAIAALKNNEIYYVICGQGYLCNSLKKLSIDLEIEDKVIFLGYRDDIIEINKMSDVFVFPSKREGLSVSVMEAMACGLPVICSDIRGNRDLVIEGKGGYLIDNNDMKSYSHAISKLLKNVNLRNKMKNFNINTIKNYDINKINKLMKDIYLNI